MTSLSAVTITLTHHGQHDWFEVIVWFFSCLCD